MAQPITWEMLFVLIGAVVALGTLILNLHSAIKKQFEAMNMKSEDRSTRLHSRLEAFSVHVQSTYLPRDLAAAEIRRLDAAVEEQHRLINGVAERLSCPASNREAH